MTEDEAKTKWCPFARVPIKLLRGGVLQSLETANRTEEGDVLGPCVGSGCMAWRTHRQGRGYCGLAGVIPSLAT